MNHGLLGGVESNFDVKCFFTRREGSLTFYGLACNAQLACYAFKCSCARIHIMMKQHMVPPNEFETKKARGLTTCTKGSPFTPAY